MRKKILGLLLTTTLAASLLVACGQKSEITTGNEEKSSSNAASESASVVEDSEGKILNIYCWNEEFKSRITDHYPGYTEVDATTGEIGDVTVKWNITPQRKQCISEQSGRSPAETKRCIRR